MGYRALYREYRPTSFSEVIGQEHIVTTLRHQVAEGHTAHAYLFCGTRGTGKTTTARILSRAANCLTPVDGEPCGTCAACLAAMGDACPDIIEIDAASNNSVDNVRALIEKAQLSPLVLRYRVYIIDEVHMLSISAFNALLKTLEEPPAHALFILATTEPQKLPATIISRCQRFDFHRLSIQDIVSTLKSVLKKAGASVEDDGLLLIARAADGGMRDALSLTDQCLAFCGDNVTTKDVYDVLGSMEEGFLFDMADALLMSDAKTALSKLNDIVRNGRDLSVFCNDLAAHFRALLLTKTCGPCQDLLDCTADAMQRYVGQAANASEARLLLALEHLLKAQGDMRYLSAPRAMLESALVRICRPEDERSIASLEARLDRLEAGGVPAPAAAVRREPALEAHKAEPPAAMQTDDFLPPPPPEDDPAPGAFQSEQLVPPAKPAAALSVAAQKSAPATKAAPAAASDADGLWAAVLDAVQRVNPMVHMMAKSGAAQSLADGQLTVGFSDADEAQFNSVSAAINYNRLQGVLTELSPGMRLVLIKIKLSPVSDAVAEKAKALFGDKLVIE